MLYLRLRQAIELRVAVYIIQTTLLLLLFVLDHVGKAAGGAGAKWEDCGALRMQTVRFDEVEFSGYQNSKQI